MRCRLGIFLVLSLAAAAALPAAPASAAKKPRCERAWVNGKETCLRAGQRCRARHNRDYLVEGFECRRRKLARARESTLRGEEVVHLRRGRPSFQTALQAFDMLVANMPGAKRRRGVVGDAESGSAALRWLLSYERRLNRRQRAALKRFLDPARVARAAQSESVFTELMERAKARLEAHGLQFHHPVRIVVDKDLVDPDDPDDSWMATAPEWLAYIGQPSGDWCTIHVKFRAIRDFPTPVIAMIAHELVHCAEAELHPTRAAWLRVPPWVSDGFANWAGATVGMELEGRIGPLADDWGRWMNRPERVLPLRVYDGMGFWQLLHNQGVDVWSRFPAVSLAGSGVSGDTVAYFTAIGSGALAARDWGPSHFGMPGLSRSWNLGGPGNPGADTSRLKPVSIRAGSSFAEYLPRRGARIQRFDLQADIIRIRATSGQFGLIRTADGVDRDIVYETYCTVPGGCVCDDGTDLELQRISPGVALFGMAGVFSAGRYEVTGGSLDQYCGSPATFAGIEVLGPIPIGPDGSPEFHRLPMIETFTRLTCRELGSGGRTLRATGSIGSMRVTFEVQGFQGWDFEDIYTFPLGATDKVIEFRGPGGFFSTSYESSLRDAGFFGGAIGTDQVGRRRAVGGAAIIMFNEAGNRAVQVLGGAPCRRPVS